MAAMLFHVPLFVPFTPTFHFTSTCLAYRTPIVTRLAPPQSSLTDYVNSTSCVAQRTPFLTYTHKLSFTLVYLTYSDSND